MAPSNEVDGPEVQETLIVTPSSTSGMTWLYVNQDGSITYNIQLDEMQETPVFSFISNVKGRKTLDAQQFVPNNFANGWASGSLDKLR